METETTKTGVGHAADERPLSDEEELVWKRLVERGMEIMAPRRAAAEARRQANRAAHAAANHRTDGGWKTKTTVRNDPIPNGVKRFIVMRASGLSFTKASAACGATWTDIAQAKAKNDTVMAAIEAQEECSRDLMKAKAMSIVEQSQDEGARPNFSQVQIASKILAGLDREHFGEDRGGVRSVEVDEPKAIGGGGFVINLIADASKTAEKAPEERPKKALVFAEV